MRTTHPKVSRSGLICSNAPSPLYLLIAHFLSWYVWVWHCSQTGERFLGSDLPGPTTRSYSGRQPPACRDNSHPVPQCRETSSLLGTPPEVWSPLPPCFPPVVSTPTQEPYEHRCRWSSPRA